MTKKKPPPKVVRKHPHDADCRVGRTSYRLCSRCGEIWVNNEASRAEREKNCQGSDD